jgi:hypothetical protein
MRIRSPHAACSASASFARTRCSRTSRMNASTSSGDTLRPDGDLVRGPRPRTSHAAMSSERWSALLSLIAAIAVVGASYFQWWDVTFDGGSYRGGGSSTSSGLGR